MATGLQTFDSFSWASLLEDRATLVVDRDAGRARRIAAALEEAGATVTLATSQAVGADRARDTLFRLVVVGLTGEEPLSERLAAGVGRPDTQVVLLAEPALHARLKLGAPWARLGDHAMTDRDLVMFITRSTDE